MLAQTPRLLIADDDRDFRATLAEMLHDRGFETVQAGDGDEALELLHRTQVHLLLLDLQMPRLSGLEMIYRLRTIETQSRVPWILLSGALDESIVAEANRAAAFSVLAKPVRLPQLTSAVRGALQQAYGWPQ
jgi:CheY-like chemotaxis protein